MSSTNLRMLTPTEREKLPPCIYSFFGKCTLTDKSPKHCIHCMIEGIFTALESENIARATEALGALIKILEHEGILKRDAKP